METAIVAILIVVILGLAILYICKAKKRGQKCIGCPDSGRCGGSCSGCCGCGSSAEDTNQDP